MLSEQFQESLKQLRTQKNLTQDELAEKLGVSGQTIYKYENGITFPPPEKIEKILHFFNVDPNNLFGYNSYSKNIDTLLRIIANEGSLQADILQELKANDESSAINLLVNRYPFLEGYNLELLKEYNDFDFERSIKKYINQELNRIIALKVSPED
ncbi:helix-turn-helix domain-containing protein [Enterococcus rivorum]|uniref:HTH cro/C1-type domain-containing protein n=1 Tax=Enterococcus rivorum TaxID=762845 RepID=A0A1E5KV37_9ENTE|nr:helix-turn-helix transcriptional regulator [Enterococcus rivorum]MBP2100370.1 transcriptional regulator with XRE-family HTH domain [Enterococcus rivorum]OEH81756.1 hypothetical protein BCR26_15405 [Enterococcus rivorum]